MESVTLMAGKRQYFLLYEADWKKYVQLRRRLAFPMIRFVSVERLLEKAATLSELEWETRLEKWARKSLAD